MTETTIERFVSPTDIPSEAWDSGLYAVPDANIHQRMVAIIRDLPAIGKNSENKQQGFMFRGVDDTLDALKPLLGKHGVHYVPRTLEAIFEHRDTRAGGVMWVTKLHVEFKFYGLGGDYVTASTWGEGTDSGDKATPKGHTGAMKYCLFEAFAIATKEQSDADADSSTAEESLPPWLGKYVGRYNKLPAEFQAKFVTRLMALSDPPKAEGWQLNWTEFTHLDWAKHIEALLDKAEAAVAKAQQDADAERPDDPAPEPENQDGADPAPTGAPPSADPAPEPDEAPAPTSPGPQADPAPAMAPEPDPEPPAPEAAPDAPAVAPDGVPTDATAEQIEAYQSVLDWLADPANKGPQVQAQLREAGLEVAGKIQDLRERLREAAFQSIFFPADDEPEPEPEVDEEPEAEVIPFAPNPPEEADEYVTLDADQASAQQASMLADTAAMITDEAVFDKWVRWCTDRGLDRDHYETWSMGNALRAFDWLDAHGL